MIKVDTKGVAAFNKALMLALAQFDRDISDAFRDWTRKVYWELLWGTPQFSSDLVRNWNYSLNAPDNSYSESPQKKLMGLLDEPLQMHDMFGMQFAFQNMLGQTPPTWRDAVYFTNATPIAEQVEDHIIYLRPVNLVNGKVIMIQHLQQKYNPQGAQL
jgi:hypothetical protein